MIAFVCWVGVTLQGTWLKLEAKEGTIRFLLASQDPWFSPAAWVSSQSDSLDSPACLLLRVPGPLSQQAPGSQVSYLWTARPQRPVGKGASPPASAGEAGRAHQSKCGSARPPVWHPGSSRLQVSPSKVWSPEQRPAHHLGTCEKLTCLGPNLDQTLCGAESGDGPPSEPPSGTPSGSGESLPLHATLW